MHWRIFMGMLIAVLCLGVTASKALGHAAHERSNPSPGQVLNASPTMIEIFTSQDLRRQGDSTSIVVTDERGSRVDNGDTVIDDANRRRYFVTLKSGLSPGRYLVNFKTLSDEDGEDDFGSFAFYLSTQPTDAQRAQDAELRLTKSAVSATPEAAGGGSMALTVGIVIGIAVVLLLVAGAWVMLRSGRAQAS